MRPKRMALNTCRSLGHKRPLDPKTGRSLPLCLRCGRPDPRKLERAFLLAKARGQ